MGKNELSSYICPLFIIIKILNGEWIALLAFILNPTSYSCCLSCVFAVPPSNGIISLDLDSESGHEFSLASDM